MNATNLGTLRWVDRTGGQLTAAERRSLLRPLAHVHAANAAGRLSMLIRLNSGRRRHIAPERTLPPSSALTRAAEEQAQRQLSPALLNHSYRTFAYGAALGAWENSPNVTLPDGPVAYLLSAGAGVDVVGLRSWQLPPDLLTAVVAQHPRLGFKRELSTTFRTEAARVPRGRVQFLRRYGAFDLAIRFAPFRG